MQDIIFPKHKKDLLESLHRRPRNSIEGVTSPRPGRGKHYAKIIGALVLVALVAWLIISFIARADVRITPHAEAINFNDVLVASRASSTPEGALSFQVMTVKDEQSTSVPASSKQAVTMKATGTVILYNTTTVAQKLVARTRLAATNGKLFRIVQDVTIPAGKNAGGKITPGSIAVKAEAALPGAEYNIGLTDFTIPGFAGTAKAKKFYGRSKTEMTGGFIGDRLVASEPAITAARDGLKKTLADSLAKKAVEAIPPGWLMYKDGTFIDLAETRSDTPRDGQDSVLIRETGTLRAVIISQEDVRAYAVNHKLESNSAASYHALGLDTLAFAIQNRGNFSVEMNDTFTFSLKGPATLVADVPLEPLAADLAGKAYADRAKVFSKYTGIEKAQVSLFPSFITSFPSSKERISVTIEAIK